MFYTRTAFDVRVRSASGEWFCVPIRTGVGLPNLHYDEGYGWFTTVLRGIYSCTAGAFIDVGANIGKLLLCVAEFDRSITYVGIEPSVDCVAYIERMIRSNNLLSHYVLPIACWDQFALLDLQMRSVADVSATVVKSIRPRRDYRITKKVLALPCDMALSHFSLDEIAVVKIDVEGAELEVLRGLRKTIDANRPALILEILPYAHIKPGHDEKYLGRLSKAAAGEMVAFRRSRMRLIQEFLRTSRYSVFQITRTGTLIRREKLDSTGGVDGSEMNYLAIPEERAIRVLRAFSVQG